MNDIELHWKNKKLEVDKIVLPFQKIETVSISRTGKGTLLPHVISIKENDWKNMLIWGDNKYVIASLLKDSSVAGKIKLIYIDPPFFTGTNMNMNIQIGDKVEVEKEPSAIEEIAYRNMWKEGQSSFLQYMYERIKLMWDLLAEDGAIYVRFDCHYSHYIKLILDSIFGYDNFQNEIIVNRIKKSDTGAMKFNVATDSLFFYTKSQTYTFNGFRKKLDEVKEERWHAMDSQGQGTPRTIFGKLMHPPVGRHWTFNQEKIDEMIKQGKIRLNPKSRKPEYKLEAVDTQLVDTNWTDIPGYSFSTGYPTENAEAVLERVIEASSNPNDIVADFFAGSGTTMAVAERLNRKWIGCDIGRFSIHTIRKRLLEIPTCKPFEVFNLGRYERKYWATETLGEDYKNYVNFIVNLYNAKPLDNFEYIHGKKGNKAIHVGLVDSPVSKKEIFDALAECKKVGFDNLDILGWEWEMGLNDSIIKEAKDLYKVNLTLLVIPREVMDKRAVEAGDVDFYELAHLQVNLIKEGNSIKVQLKDFIIPNPELIPVEAQKKIKKWSDYIDYWAVDWNFNEVFHNQWQIYRTKEIPNLKLETPFHDYKKGKYQILIKVIDVFGNDTSTMREIVIK
jgi:adenine specific DNA methylase Mod